ncbi:MAG TPA: FecR family protein [Planctomycetota bacterium]
MTRAEELVLKSIDESLDAAERAELDLLRKDPETERRCAALEEVEGALLGGRKLPDLGEAVVERLRRGQTERVMERVRSTSPEWARRRKTWPRVAAAAALFAAVLVPGLLRTAPLARVVEGDPDAFVVRGSASLTADVGLALRPDDFLVTCSRDVVLQYEGESTRVRVVPLSELYLRGDRRSKRIELKEGEIQADVAPQERPLIIAAAHAQAEVLGTRLRISATKDATRLEVAEGKVRFTRKDDGAALLVSANQYTVAVPKEEFVACELPAAAEVPPWTAGFSLIRLDFPYEEIPGFEDLRDGAVISLSKMPTRRLNVRANTEPDRVGSVRFAYLGRETYNTEMVWPYTLVPNDGCEGPPWDAKPGRHTVTATPYTGSFGNGLRGDPKKITFTIVE